MMLQVVMSPMIIILMTLEVSFTLLENIYSTGVSTDDCHGDCNILIVQANGVPPGLCLCLGVDFYSGHTSKYWNRINTCLEHQWWRRKKFYNIGARFRTVLRRQKPGGKPCPGTKTMKHFCHVIYIWAEFATCIYLCCGIINVLT